MEMRFYIALEINQLLFVIIFVFMTVQYVIILNLSYNTDTDNKTRSNVIQDFTWKMSFQPIRMHGIKSFLNYSQLLGQLF